jgi:predicted dehydrogenase
MGGGVHLDLFHELDYTTWLFGFPNKSKSIVRSVSSLAIDAIDYANYIFEYDTFTANIVLNYYRKIPKRQIEIVLDCDTWTVDLLKNEIKNDEGELLFKAENYEANETYFHQLNYFINCLKTEKVPMNSFSSSIEILKICLNNV